MTARPRVAIIHGVLSSIEPARLAFTETFNEAELWNVLDDRLMTDASEHGLTPELEARMEGLIAHCIRHGAAAVLLACSLYSSVATRVRPDYTQPILSSDEALFDDIAQRRPQRVVLVAAQQTAATDSAQRLAAHLDAAGLHLPIVTRVPDRPPHGDLAEAVLADVQPVLEPKDLLVLGNFSLAPARDAIETTLHRPAPTPPHLAAARLRSLLLPEALA